MEPQASSHPYSARPTCAERPPHRHRASEPSTSTPPPHARPHAEARPKHHHECNDSSTNTYTSSRHAPRRLSPTQALPASYKKSVTYKLRPSTHPFQPPHHDRARAQPSHVRVRLNAQWVIISHVIIHTLAHLLLKLSFSLHKPSHPLRKILLPHASLPPIVP